MSRQAVPMGLLLLFSGLCGCLRQGKRQQEVAMPELTAAPVLVVPGAPAGCTASYTLPAEPLLARGDAASLRLRQVPGVLWGPAWGACSWMGPTTEAGEGLWVIMVWWPAWRGEVWCQVGEQRSPSLLLQEPSVVAPVAVKVKWYTAMPGADGFQEAPFPVPTSNMPCHAAPPRDVAAP